MGVVDFRREIELGGDDFFGQSGAQAALFREPPPLRGRRAGDDDDPVEACFGLRLKEQRDVHDEPAALAGDLRGACDPARPDGRVQDALKLPPFRFIVENERTQPGAVGISFCVTNGIAKSLRDRLTDRGIMGQQLVRSLIGVEKFGGKMAQEQAGERRFPGGNSAGDAEDGHSPILRTAGDRRLRDPAEPVSR